MRRAVLLCTLLIVQPHAALAHPAPFSYIDIRLSDTGIDGSLVVHDFDVAHDFGVEAPERLLDPAFAASYREPLARLMASRLALVADGVHLPIAWTDFETLPDRQSLRLGFRAAAARPARVRVEAVLFPYDPVHQTFVNVYEDGSLRHQAIIGANHATAEYYAGTWQGALSVVGVFVPAGVEHILIGPDHVLFLVGLLLLGGTMWRLATIVTAFTIGHSITLSLAALNVVSPPASLVEPAIALSIIFVGADNLLVQKDAGPGARDIRAWIAGVFGLVHGFGFASVLKEFGLPATALGWSLFSFNLGVEIGQLLIVFAVALGLRALYRRRPDVTRRVVIAGSVIVILAGGYWFVERVFLARGA
jgi:hydrogenase/urease accessory protein HupE